jgi:hypothetical protein
MHSIGLERLFVGLHTYVPTSTLPAGTPFVLLNLREKNCIMGSISSLLLGIESPGLRYRLNSTNSKTRFSLSSAAEVTVEASEPAHTSTGVLHLGPSEAGASAGSGAPMLIMPPSSLRGEA